MSPEYTIRAATRDDAREIAKLIAISSDGAAEIEWHEQAGIEHRDPLDIGEHTYQNPQGDYSLSGPRTGTSERSFTHDLSPLKSHFYLSNFQG